MAALRVGDEIAGHRILAELGRGGMGVVYRVLQLTLDDERALKVIIPELAAQEEFRSRFLREVRAAARVKHPNVLSVHSADEVDGQLFVSMPLVQGGDLGELIEQRGRLSPEEAMPPLDQIAAALDAAHARGLIHRDVKPANVLIDEHGHVYLSDFGLARALGSKTNFTATGTWVGTPEYMAPEQFGAGSPSERSDVYSLGCVLFEMLTGRAVFADADSLPAKIGAHMFTEPPALTERAPELPQALERVINTALAKSPEDRHASAGELALAAARALEGPQEAASENGGAPAAEAPPRPEPASEETSGPAPATRRAPPPSWLAS